MDKLNIGDRVKMKYTRKGRTRLLEGTIQEITHNSIDERLSFAWVICDDGCRRDCFLKYITRSK